MARLIDAKKAETQIKEALKQTNPYGMGLILRWIRSQPTVDVTRQLEELEEAVASQRKRADRAETFICMMCAECEWEEHNGLITMQKACCSLFPIDCGKFKLRPNCGEKMDLKEE